MREYNLVRAELMSIISTMKKKWKQEKQTHELEPVNVFWLIKEGLTTFEGHSIIYQRI